mmetsp:Transcript_2085/g.4744  ORF Transcript_2085/g.4744 Transcript_2085/m.4744 type:complete len:240 (+) Transcript_2085:100-819(+)
MAAAEEPAEKKASEDPSEAVKEAALPAKQACPPVAEPSAAAPQAEAPVPPVLKLQPGAVPPSLETFGWKPRDELSGDENGVDLVLLLARNSICRGGSMGCALAQPDGTIVACATNGPLYLSKSKRPASDVHAEVNAIGRCAREGMVTEGCVAYITMPPCKRCLTVLVASGVSRIVSRKPFLEQDAREALPALQNLGIPYVIVNETEERRIFREGLVAKRKSEHQDSDGCEPPTSLQRRS